MTRHQLLVRLLKDWGERLRLQSWTVELITDADDFLPPDANKQVKGGASFVYIGSQRGWIKIGPNAMVGDDPHKARNILVHESMHLRWWRAGEAVYVLNNEAILTKAQWSLFESQYLNTEEVCLDETARAFLACPGWLKDDRWFLLAWRRAGVGRRGLHE